MRRASPAEVAAVNSRTAKVHAEIWVGDVGGHAPIAGALGGVNPLLKFSIQKDIKNLAEQATITCHLGKGSTCLSPYQGSGAKLAGPLGVKPVFEEGRELVIRTSVTGGGPGAFRRVFIGVIDDTDAAGSDETVVVHCRDLIGARLLDTQIANTTQVTENGVTSHKWGFPVAAGGINAVLAAILDATWVKAYGNGWPEPFVTPLPWAELVLGEFWQDRVANLGEALRIQALKTGHDLRGRWEPPGYSNDQFLLTFYQPNRLGYETFFLHYPGDAPPGQYFYQAITRLSKPLANIRNVWEGTPFDATNPAVRIPQVVSDPASIARYGTVGYRFAYIAEDRASGINTPAKMGVMLDGALADHKDAQYGVTVQTPYNWIIELGDFIYLGPDPARSDLIGPLAVSGVNHEFDQGDAFSVFEAGQVTGAAAGLGERGKPLIPARNYVALTPPQGPGREGDTWYQVLEIPLPPVVG